MEIERPLDAHNNSAAVDSNYAQKSHKSPDTSKVQVALRVRPFVPKEIIDNEPKCVTCYPNSNQIVMGKDREFSFDRVFDDNSKQVEVYEYCAKGLVLSCLSGYNATVLAYGQTGSGKTFTMGSTTTCDAKQENIGIIPRVIKDLFIEIDKQKGKTDFAVKVGFLEIYNEEIHDLLDPSLTNARLK